jgi:hypothetical protein
MNKNIDYLIKQDVLTLEQFFSEKMKQISQILNILNLKSTEENYNKLVEKVEELQYYYAVLTFFYTIFDDDSKVYFEKHIKTLNNFRINFRVDQNLLTFLENISLNDENLNYWIYCLKNYGANFNNVYKKKIMEVLNLEDKIFDHLGSPEIDIGKYLEKLKKCKKVNDRLQIEKNYAEVAKKYIKPISNLLINRNEIAKQLNYSNYFHYITKKEENDIEQMLSVIRYLVSTTDYSNEIFINKIYKLNGKKLSRCDIMYYSIPPSNSINLEKALKILISLIEQKLKISIKYIRNVNNFNVYNVNNWGELWINLFCSNYKSYNPVFIKISDIDDSKKSALIGNYGKTINYIDIVSIAREFGLALQQLASTDKIKKKDSEFHNCVSNVLEWLIKDNHTITQFIPSFQDGNISKTVESIKRYYQYTEPLSLRFRCINALFDYYIHHNDEFIKSIKNDKANSKELYKHYNQVYKNLTYKVMKNFIDYINLDGYPINPSVLIQLVNGEQSVVFASIICDIFSYNIYLNLDKYPKRFVNDILNSNKTIRERVNDFIDNCNLDTSVFVSNYSNKFPQADNKKGIIEENDDKTLSPNDEELAF